MAKEPSEQYWYNTKTGRVEFGFESSVVDRVGPFETAAEASHALERLRANSAKWDADEAAED